ncbi:hypothetical protein R8Z50_10690 [Longispora sp. K20-0274]|uniref:hypothetical protein n=1 Tax=Longispora sp. K20-0274 TaxID=3088255 RepID=UPI00399BE051
MRDDADRFVNEVTERREEWLASRQRIEVIRERGWLQATPQGDLFVLMLEGTDPVAANTAFAASREPFDVWFKERAGAMMAVDFDQPIPVHPELIYTSVPDDSTAEQAVAVAIPLLPGKTDAHRRIAAEVNGPRRAGFDAFHEHAGVTEDWWIQPTPMGDLVLLYLESDDLAAAMAHLARSQVDTEVWFKKATLDTEGIDWSGPPPALPEQLFDWRV